MVGLEYEFRLAEQLRNSGVPFLTQGELQERGELRSLLGAAVAGADAHARAGHAKTPDVCLLSPISVRGRVVNWIDSKAMFGGERRSAAWRRRAASRVHAQTSTG
jgi:hypothetical protein